MDELTTRYEETLERMPWPVMVVGSKLKIEFWNTAAQKLFGFNSTPAAEMRLEQLPVPQALRSRIIRRQRAALSRNMRMVLRNETLDGPRSRASLKVYFMPLARDGSPESVLIMFDVQNPTTSERAGKNDNPRASSRSREAARSGINSPTRGKAKRRGRK
jgi:PAS domain S-box-containing protein